MSWEGIYLIDVAEGLGYCNRSSTIKQVGNHTSTRHVFVPTLDKCSRGHRQCTSILVSIYG